LANNISYILSEIAAKEKSIYSLFRNDLGKGSDCWKS
jgi:hypothetical protein